MITILDTLAGSPDGLFSAALAEASDAVARRPDGALLDGVELVYAFDAASLEHAARARVPSRIAVLPRFDTRFGGELDAAHGIAVVHERVRDALPSHLRARAHVVGPLAPPSFAPRADRRAARRAAGLDERPVVLVPAPLLESLGATTLLLQLDLVGAEATYLFDVGMDVEAAEAIRRVVPTHDLDAALFAREPESGRHWALADVVLGQARGEEVPLALASGAGLVLLRGGDRSMTDALVAADVAVVAEVPSVLAVAIDEALGRADTLSAAARAMDAAGSAARLLALGDELRARPRTAALPAGLPRGLERIARVEAHFERDAEPLPTASARDDEGDIDRELEALKRKLGQL